MFQLSGFYYKAKLANFHLEGFRRWGPRSNIRAQRIPNISP